PSHGRSVGTLHEFLADQGIPGISEIDTRAVTRRLRSQGVMMGIITTAAPEVALKRLRDAPRYGDGDYVATVSTGEGYEWDSGDEEQRDAKHHILVTDCGLKYNILRHLRRRSCRVTVVPAATPADELLAMKPSGITTFVGSMRPLCSSTSRLQMTSPSPVPRGASMSSGPT
ncbi:MAG: carbamoyl phosphate synthase small subunit, partial [Planctomycetes bacterium]|nr:carbamoyl phosphate synthase small subunit [Planctomycetota bacterium]